MPFVLLALGAVALNAAALWLKPPAFVEIVVEDSVFHEDLAGRSVRITRRDAGDRASIAASVEAGGLVRVGRVPSGTNHLTLDVEGYDSAELSLVTPALEKALGLVLLKPSFGRVAIAAYDARTRGENLSDLRIALSGETRTGSEEVVFSGLAPGEHRLEASAAGYCPESETAVVRPGKTTRIQVPLSPELEGAEMMRIMLDWDEHPRDLDAHVILSGSQTRVDREHLYFGRKQGKVRSGDQGLYAQLDVDWLQSEGVETITVYNRAEGVYQYFVDHFAGASTLGRSNAEVVVMTKGCRREVFRVPPDCDRKWWYVADIRIKDGESQLVERGECQAGIPYSWNVAKSGS